MTEEERRRRNERLPLIFRPGINVIHKGNVWYTGDKQKAATNLGRYNTARYKVKNGLPEVREKPKQSIFNKFSDLLDANTDADKYRRLLNQEPEDYAQQQKNRGVGRVANNPWQRATNTGRAAYEGFTEAPRKIGVGLARGTEQQAKADQSTLDYQRTRDDVLLKAQRRLLDPSTPLDEKQRWYNYLKSEYPKAQIEDRETRQQLEQNVKDTDQTAALAAIAEMGFDIATLGVGSVTFKGAKAAAKAGTKELLEFLVKNGVKPIATGATAGGIGTITNKGSDVTAKDIAIGATAGGTLAAGFPLVGAGVGRLTRKIKGTDKLFRELAEETDEAVIKTTLKNASKDIDDSIVDGLAPVLAKETDTKVIKAIVDGVSDSTSIVPKELSKALAGTKDKNAIRQGIDGLAPDVTEADKVRITDTIHKSNSPETIEKALEEIAEKQEILSKQVAEQIPDPAKGTPNEQLAEEIAELPPEAQINIGKQVDAEDSVTSVSKDIQQGKIDQPTTIEEAAEQARIKAEESKASIPKETAKQKWDRIWDPRQPFVNLDRQYAKKVGKKYRDLSADERLEALTEVTSSSDSQAVRIFKGTDSNEVLKKYGEGTTEGVEFNYYRVAKIDLERRLDGRAPIMRDVDTDSLKKTISQYEAKNPQAETDLLTMVSDIEQLQMKAATDPDASFIDMEDLMRARTKKDGSSYQFYTPVQRAMPDEILRPTIRTNNVGTLARQKVLQDLDGSDIPFDPSFNSITDYYQTVIRQINQSRAVKKFAQRVDEGLVPGAKIIQTGEASRGIKELRNALNSAIAERKKLSGKHQRTRFKTSKANTAKKGAESQATKKFRKVMREEVADPDARAAIDAAKPNEILEYLTILENEPNAPAVRRARTNLSKKSKAHEQLLNDLDDLRMEMKATDGLKKGYRKEIYELQPPETNGMQKITGLDKQGNKFIIEVTPEYSRALQGFGDDGVGGLKYLKMLQQPFRQAFTGILNPSFQIKQSVFNALMLPLIDNHGMRTWGPKAIKAGIKSFRNSDEFTDLLIKNGAVEYGGGLEKLSRDTTAEALASEANILTKLDWNKNPGRAWKKLEAVGGKIDRAARVNSARVAYDAAIKQELPVEKAIANAVYAYNNVLPNFANLSTAVRNVDSVLMYSGASQAGTRTLLRAARNNPAQFATKLGSFGAAVAGIGAFNNAHDAGQEYYADMVQSGRGYDLDNNIVIVLPGAKKNEETGEWSGVVKIPVAPELRPITTGVWKTFYSDEGVNPKQLALSAFDFVTGQTRTLSSPVANFLAGAATGTDPSNGRKIWDETMSSEEKREAIFKHFGRSSGTVGRVVTGQASPSKIISDIWKPYYGSKGSTPGSRYYQRRNEAIKSQNLSREEMDTFNSAISPPSKDLLGNDVKDKSYYDSATKALAWLEHPKLFEVSKEIDRLGREEGLPGDPLFDLDDRQRKVVLNMMANYSPGNFEDKAIAQLNPWIEGFNEKRSEYFDKVMESLTPEQREEASYDPKGIKKVIASDEVQAKLDQLKNITDGAERAKFYDENPDVTDFYSQLNAYQRTKREFMGLPQFDNYPEASPEVDAWMDEYNKLPSKNGPAKKDGTPSSPDRSAWIKANPDKWAKMTEYWTALDFYKLQQEGALAVYEGIDFSEDGLKSIQDISGYLDKQGGGGGYGGYGYGSGGGGSDDEADARTYVGKLLSGMGSTLTPPKVNVVAKTPTLRYKKPFKGSKPKVRFRFK